MSSCKRTSKTIRDVIGAQHEFHDEEFVDGWAERFVPTSERLKLFSDILAELNAEVPADGCLVELGTGPGYLAAYLLSKMPGIKYYGIDFSGPMLEIARQRLRPHAARVYYVQADLVNNKWWVRVPMQVNAIVSTWTLHDLGSQEKVKAVYEKCAHVLRGSGVLLNGDFIKPDRAIHEYEPGRFEIARHIEMLYRAGFRKAECLAVFEEEIESPTAAQNYACFKGVA